MEAVLWADVLRPKWPKRPCLQWPGCLQAGSEGDRQTAGPVAPGACLQVSSLQVFARLRGPLLGTPCGNVSQLKGVGPSRTPAPRLGGVDRRALGVCHQAVAVLKS